MHEKSPVGKWAMNISYCKRLSEEHSISTSEDLIKLEEKGLPETISPTSLIFIKRYCSLTPEEHKQLEEAGVFELRDTSISIHEKVRIILDFCATGQELTR